MTRLPLIVAIGLTALPALAFAQTNDAPQQPAGAAEGARSADGRGSAYVGNSGRLAPNGGVEREPSSAGKAEQSADDPSLNAGIYATPHGKRQ